MPGSKWTKKSNWVIIKKGGFCVLADFLTLSTSSLLLYYTMSGSGRCCLKTIADVIAISLHLTRWFVSTTVNCYRNKYLVVYYLMG